MSVSSNCILTRSIDKGLLKTDILWKFARLPKFGWLVHDKLILFIILI